jgi:hypothetical protein
MILDTFSGDFNRPFHGLPQHSEAAPIPAMNRWAIFDRPLCGLVLSCRAFDEIEDDSNWKGAPPCAPFITASTFSEATESATPEPHSQ